MTDINYSQIVSALSDLDKKTVRESIGIDVDTITVDRIRLENYFDRRKRTLERISKQLQQLDEVSIEEWQTHCSFCHGRNKSAPYVIKLSEPHVICAGCIDILIKGATV